MVDSRYSLCFLLLPIIYGVSNKVICIIVSVSSCESNIYSQLSLKECLYMFRNGSCKK